MPSADFPIHAAVPPQRIDKNGVRVREDVLYGDSKGRSKGKLRKRANAVFEQLGEELRRVLEPDETIFYIAVAQAMPGAFAQFFGGGWHTYSLPRTLLFFTERRIIAFRQRKHITSWVWDRGIRTVRWGDVQNGKPGGFVTRYLTLKFRNGEQQGYWRFASGDFKKVRLLVDTLRVQASGETAAAGGMVSLCPGCLAPLSQRTYQCPGCGFRFKDEKTLVRRGILIPGGASLYVGATGLGVLRSVFETIILLSILTSVYRAIRDPRGLAVVGPLMLAVVFECGVLILDKMMAIALSRPQIRDFLPLE
jgi:hypothetical protein